MLKRSICIIALLCFTVSISSGQELDSLLNIGAFTAESDLQKQLNQSTKVASGFSLTTRETPGIVSVITSEEMQNSGARDLTDVLRMIPGFDIGQDLQFVQGISLRGNWANEGKVLVLLDGQPMNELLYQTVVLGNRFAVDAIDKIEIIRGPGSAIYGGSAEYGVINIITKAANSLDGVYVHGIAGLHEGGVTGRTNGGVMVAEKRRNFSWDFSAFAGKGIMSDQQYQDFAKEIEPQDLSKKSGADPTNFNVGVRYKNLQVRMMYDAYSLEEPTAVVDYKSYFADVSYVHKMNDKLTVTPRIQYMNQNPWDYDYKETDQDDFDIDANRVLGQVDGVYNSSRKVSINMGALYFADKGIDNLADESITLNNFAVYTQALFKHRLANATLGFRFEKNNRYDGAFVPRLALTKKIENFHFKVLYSRAFRSPSIQNIKLDTTGAEPEISNVVEFELGYQFTPEMLITLNAFHISTNDVLIYGSQGIDDDFEEWYENYDKSGSQGLELLYSIKKKRWYTHFSYSFSQALSDNTVDKYVAPQTNKQYIAQLAHKVTLNTSINVTEKISANPTVIYGGKRFAYTGYDENGDPESEKLNPYTLMNIFVNYRNLAPGLTLGLGVYDLLNERPAVPQAYNGEFAAIPGRSREYVVRLSYQLNFRRNEK
jgi:outer membrane receptor for ferrienterochelin and colicin